MNVTQPTAWAYAPETGLFLGEVWLQPDQQSPGEYFTKPNTILFPPPAMPEGMTAKSIAVDGIWKWEVIPDPIVPEPPSLEELQAGAIRATNMWADEQRNAGFEWQGHTFQSDFVARESLLAIHAGGVGTPLGFWRSADNQNIPDGSPEMITSLVQAMNDRGTAIFVRRNVMKAQVMAATKVEDLKDFSPAWE